MQPLISPVDHESRRHSYREEGTEPQTSEHTPLLAGRPARQTPERRDHVVALIVTAMLLMLIAGAIIGTYLLIEQERWSPEEAAFRLVPREEWDAGTSERLLAAAAPVAAVGAPAAAVVGAPAAAVGAPAAAVRAPEAVGAPAAAVGSPARHVLVLHTDTEECDDLAECNALLRRLLMQRGDMPYNFLVSSEGQAYEALGWRSQSTLPTTLQDPPLVLAFIGNFTDTYPSTHQVKTLQLFCNESLRRHRLAPSYTIVAHQRSGTPSHLLEALSSLEQWDRSYSDTMNQKHVK